MTVKLSPCQGDELRDLAAHIVGTRDKPMSKTLSKLREKLETLASTAAKAEAQSEKSNWSHYSMNVGRKLRDLIRGRQK